MDKWIDGEERRAVLAGYARRLWDARAEARLWTTRVDFDGCRYDVEISPPNEFSTGVARLREGEDVYRLARHDDEMTGTLDAVVAWRILARLPDDVVDGADQPDLTPSREGVLGQLLKRLGLTREQRAAPIPADDPRALVLLDFGRAMLALVRRSGHPPYGSVMMDLGHGLVLDARDMCVEDRNSGMTRIPAAWHASIREEIERSEQADMRWMAREAARLKQPVHEEI